MLNERVGQSVIVRHSRFPDVDGILQVLEGRVDPLPHFEFLFQEIELPSPLVHVLRPVEGDDRGARHVFPLTLSCGIRNRTSRLSKISRSFSVPLPGRGDRGKMLAAQEVKMNRLQTR